MICLKVVNICTANAAPFSFFWLTRAGDRHQLRMSLMKNTIILSAAVLAASTTGALAVVAPVVVPEIDAAAGVAALAAVAAGVALMRERFKR
jgi:hypothetical protein